MASSMHPRLLSVLANLRCPVCRENSSLLKLSGDRLVCSHCSLSYAVDNNVPILFSSDGAKLSEVELSSASGKSMVSEYEAKEANVDSPNKKRDWVQFIRPPEVIYHVNPDLKKPPACNIFSHAGETTAILNVGGGPHRYSECEVSLNLAQFDNVDLVGDAHNIPFTDNTFDSVICNAVLEHVYNPEIVVAEIFRVLKPGGYVYAEIPFIFFFHGYPNDFKRYTKEGVSRLFDDFAIHDLGITNGPASAMLLSLNVFLQLLLPTRRPFFHKVLNGCFRWLFFPLKYLDIIVNKHPDAHMLAAGFYVFAQKAGQVKPEGTGE